MIFAELDCFVSFACVDVQLQQWALMINIWGPVSGDKLRIFQAVFPAARCPVDSLSSEDKCFLPRPEEERSVVSECITFLYSRNIRKSNSFAIET